MGNLRHSVFLILTVSMSAFSDVIPQDDSPQMQIQEPECVKIYPAMGFNAETSKTVAQKKKGEKVYFFTIAGSEAPNEEKTISDEYTKEHAEQDIEKAQQKFQAKLGADYTSVREAIEQAGRRYKDAKRVEKNANDKSADTTKNLDQYSSTILSNTSAAYGQAIKCEQNANDAIRDFSTCSSDSKNAFLDLKPTKLKIEACIKASASYEKVELVAQSKTSYEGFKAPADNVSAALSALSKSCLGDNGLMAIEKMPAKCTQAQNSAQGILGQSGQGNVAKDEEEQKQPQGQQSGNGQPSPQQQAGAGTPEKEKPKANEPKVASEDPTKSAADKAEAAAKAEAERIAALNASGFVECTDPANPTGPKQKVSKAFGCTSDAVAAAANVINSGTAANLTPDASTPSVPSKNPNSLTSGNPAVAALPADSATVGGGRALASGNSSSRSLGGSLSSGRSLFGGSNFNMNGLGSSGKADAGKEGAVTNANMLFTKGLNCAKPEHLNKKQKLACDRQKSILKTTDVSTDVSADARYQSLEK